MKISDIQERLKAIQEAHGDVEILISCGGPCTEPKKVEYFKLWNVCLIESNR